MISREDFLFTIGYDGLTAIVDGKARRQYSSLSTMQLAEQGLFRAAFASALYSGKPDEMRTFIDFFNGKAGTSFSDASQMARLFGVGIEQVNKILVV